MPLFWPDPGGPPLLLDSDEELETSEVAELEFFRADRVSYFCDSAAKVVNFVESSSVDAVVSITISESSAILSSSRRT